jgi:hypothetical protein
MSRTVAKALESFSDTSVSHLEREIMEQTLESDRALMRYVVPVSSDSLAAAFFADSENLTKFPLMALGANRLPLREAACRLGSSIIKTASLKKTPIDGSILCTNAEASAIALAFAAHSLGDVVSTDIFAPPVSP